MDIFFVEILIWKGTVIIFVPLCFWFSVCIQQANDTTTTQNNRAHTHVHTARVHNRCTFSLSLFQPTQKHENTLYRGTICFGTVLPIYKAVVCTQCNCSALLSWRAGMQYLHQLPSLAHLLHVESHGSWLDDAVDHQKRSPLYDALSASFVKFQQPRGIIL